MKALSLFLASIVFSISAHAASDFLPRHLAKLGLFHSVVLIGDSQTVGFFGAEMQTQLVKQKNLFVQSVGMWGTGADQWLGKSPFKTEIMKRIGTGSQIRCTNCMTTGLEYQVDNYFSKPELVIVQLGGNMLPLERAKNRESIRNLIRVIHSIPSQCAWIGPSNGKRDQERFKAFYEDLRQVTREENCALIDSRDLTSYPEGQGDGIHFQYLGALGGDLAERWACGVIERLSKEFSFVESTCDFDLRTVRTSKSKHQ